ncbi:hypothetical protein NDU88_004174 [Pleurodeles waltl]|uniref:Uncharacterized protein n=1 Tax=Pleurodeles waltl TaxID=8319 RepID=A0AAV7WR47_PLEWA|nr:hypothetical protein NDU88_004174 [Pleurodeles waltl]
MLGGARKGFPHRRCSNRLRACDMLAADWMLQGALEEMQYGAPTKMAAPIPDGDVGDKEQPSTSWGVAGFVGIAGRDKDTLDYDEEDCLEEGEIVEEEAGDQLVMALASGSGRMVNNQRSVGVLQMVVQKPLQSDVGGSEECKEDSGAVSIST